MQNQWQNETLGGYPVENLRPISMGVWKWQGEVTYPDGEKYTLTWTEDGYNGADERPRNSDLIPSLDPSKVQSHNRMVLSVERNHNSICPVETNNRFFTFTSGGDDEKTMGE